MNWFLPNVQKAFCLAKVKAKKNAMHKLLLRKVQNRKTTKFHGHEYFILYSMKDFPACMYKSPQCQNGLILLQGMSVLPAVRTSVVLLYIYMRDGIDDATHNVSFHFAFVAWSDAEVSLPYTVWLQAAQAHLEHTIVGNNITLAWQSLITLKFSSIVTQPFIHLLNIYFTWIRNFQKNQLSKFIFTCIWSLDNLNYVHGYYIVSISVSDDLTVSDTSFVIPPHYCHTH